MKKSNCSLAQQLEQTQTDLKWLSIRWLKPVKLIAGAGLEKVKQKVKEYLAAVAVRLGIKMRRRSERRKRELIVFVKELKMNAISNTGGCDRVLK